MDIARPLVAVLVLSLASATALAVWRAVSAAWRTVTVISSTAAAVCSSEAAWFSVRRARSSPEALSWLTVAVTAWTEATTESMASCRAPTAPSKSAPSLA